MADLGVERRYDGKMMKTALAVLTVLVIRSCVASADPAQPLDRDPVFVPDGRAKDGASSEQATKIANLAMHAVYDRCSKFAAFREGSTIKADYQNYKRVFSNVTVDLANPAKASGNTLWYQVFFQGGRPVSMKATKDIAAELCGLPGRDVEVKL